MAIGSITISGPRSTVVDFPVSYYQTASGYLAHIPRGLSKWAALLRPYKLRSESILKKHTYLYRVLMPLRLHYKHRDSLIEMKYQQIFTK